jgi:post-segregation antitoxin (ccd killing protein)
MIVSTIEMIFEDLFNRDAFVTYSNFNIREIFESYSRLRAFLFNSEMIRVIISMTAYTILIAMSCSTNVKACNRVSTSKFLLWDLNNVTWKMNDMIERNTENENSKKKPERWKKENDRMMILLYHAKILKYTLAWTFSVILRTQAGFVDIEAFRMHY